MTIKIDSEIVGYKVVDKKEAEENSATNGS